MASEEHFLRVQLGLPKSDGALILGRRLGDPRAWAYAVQMWDWFAEKHPEGELVGPDAAYLIASGAGWTAEEDRFCAAMVAAGFLAVIPEGFRVRGWKEWAGYYFTVKAKARAKKAAQRAKEDESPACPGDVPGTSEGQEAKKAASEGTVPGTPLPSLVSDLKSTEGVQGERPKPARLRYVSPHVPDPTPQTTAVLAALLDRGIDAAPPSQKHGQRVEAAIVSATIPVAVERLAKLLADPNAERPLTFHIDAIRGASPKATKAANGRPDLSQMDYSKPPEF